MGFIDRALLAAADVNIQTTFFKSLELTPTLYQRFTTEIASTHRSEMHAWMGALGTMKEWLDDAQFEKLRAYTFTLLNKSWQMGLEVDRDDIADDNLGIVTPAIQGLSTAAKRHPDDLVFALLNAGFAGTLGLAYDGQFFFDTDHRDGTGPVQSNKGTAVLTTASLRAAAMVMQQLKNDRNRPIVNRPTHLVVPPALQATAEDILNTQFLGSGASNPTFHMVDLIVAPQLTSTTAWFLMDLQETGLKPFIFQTREPLEMASQDNMTDEHAFMRKVYRWSVFARYNAGYGSWQRAWGSDGTV
jgi:phage major head subunit gpT-like protein